MHGFQQSIPTVAGGLPRRQDGDISIRLLLPKVDNARFRSDLQTQFRQYQATASNAENQMKAMGRCPKEVTNGKYALLWLSLQGTPCATERPATWRR
ncbi:MAG: hypothetical protein V8S71_05400 [Oscillospiraceae bacterium]